MSSEVSDRAARQRLILRSVWITVSGTLAAIWLAYRLVPSFSDVDGPAARLALAARWLVVAMLPYVAMCLAIAGIRLFEGSHDPTRGEESHRLQVHRLAMQNTLEQLVWFSACLFAVAPMLTEVEVRLVPIVCVAFLVARLVYWRGYFLLGSLGRSPGVQITFTVNILLLTLALTRLFHSP
jgi:uncharacterized membrane protein YecN with MAPEG domain